ncbi:hypothetical protein B9Z55_021198 [Caenorhabditis nigoni]|uniref:DUF38 domain-containing protein n=1 Tax=Caenorhabditis nigoni TaxID=1611254 RepID=A0A2G5TR35_9PELO|nr:hypothetical protein B9Z55_021198 [Caenorhabditis nigoni]
MNVNVEDVCHFSWISLKTNSLDVRDFDTLKKTFVSSSKFEGARIELKNFNEEEELSYIWGPGFFIDRARKWYFRMKEFEEKILLVEATHPFPVILQGYYRINFDICEMTDVPNGAIVQDYNEN